jgi:hypothetical protein
MHFRLQVSVRGARAVLDLGRKPKSTENPNAYEDQAFGEFPCHIFYAPCHAMPALGLSARQSDGVEFITSSVPIDEDCVGQGLRWARQPGTRAVDATCIGFRATALIAMIGRSRAAAPQATSKSKNG